MSEWQPIETAPRDGTEILILIPLVWKNNEPVIGNYIFTSNSVGFVWQNRNGYWVHEHSPTHWMPMPSLPTVKLSKAAKH